MAHVPLGFVHIPPLQILSFRAQFSHYPLYKLLRQPNPTHNLTHSCLPESPQPFVCTQSPPAYIHVLACSLRTFAPDIGPTSIQSIVIIVG